jgi:hypothetical protein
MKKMSSKSKKIVAVLGIVFLFLASQNIYGAVCKYYMSGDFVGELSHCSTMGISFIFFYERTVCVYKGTTTNEGISYSGVRYLDEARANQC